MLLRTAQQLRNFWQSFKLKQFFRFRNVTILQKQAKKNNFSSRQSIGNKAILQTWSLKLKSMLLKSRTNEAENWQKKLRTAGRYSEFTGSYVEKKECT